MSVRTSVAIWAGAQPAPAELTLGALRLTVGTPEVMDVVMERMASPDVQRHAEATYRLAEIVDRLTRRLERESDTALLAIAGWGTMPKRTPPLI